MSYIVLIIIFGLLFSVGITITYRWIKSIDGAKQRRFATKMSIVTYSLIICFSIISVLLPGEWAIPSLILSFFLIGLGIYTRVKIKKMNSED